MALIDTYRDTLSRKKDEKTRLNQTLAQEQAKIASLQKKAISAQEAIGRTKNQSTIKSRLNDIERANRDIAAVQQKCADLQKKIAQKDKEIATAEKNLRNEEEKVEKKRIEEAKRNSKIAEQREAAIQARLRQHDIAQSRIQAEIDELKNIPEKITVLFLAANPIDTLQLRLDEEARAIHEKIRLSEYRDSVVFESRWATRSSDILQAINETNPTIVHFSGHGAENGDLALLNTDGTCILVSKEKISAAMSTMSDTIRLVVFNACFSEIQAENVVNHIDAAIGMSTSIGDEAARVFAAQLYSSIGFGYSLQKAFNQAKAELILEGIQEEDTPKLYCHETIDPNNLILVQV